MNKQIFIFILFCLFSSNLNGQKFDFPDGSKGNGDAGICCQGDCDCGPCMIPKTITDSLGTRIICVPDDPCICNPETCEPCTGCGSGSNVRGPIDPNDIIPPNAVGDEGWIRREQDLPFTVLFENLPNATLAAQDVFIDVPLGPNVDYSSFELGDFGFGELYYVMPPGLQQFDEILEVSAQFGVNVRVTATIDVSVGLAQWVFQAYDPLTGLPIDDDELIGFLPPNDPNIGNGEGFVNFNINADPASQTYDMLDLAADIIFDDNDAIATPMAELTVDADAPSSTVSPTVTAPNAFFLELNWSGMDVGSGLANYTLFVSENGGSYRPWLVETDTTAGLLEATLGNTYRIFSIARDSVGNVEQKPPFDLEINFTPDLIQSDGPQAAMKVFLQGPLDPSTELMNDALRSTGLLPQIEPYTSLGYTHILGGNESVGSDVLAVTGNNAIVDWVITELRDRSDETSVLYSRSALLQRDGDIVDLDGVSPLTFTGMPDDEYYLAIRHRNHLGIMTASPIAVSVNPTTLDFTDNSVPLFGTDAQGNSGGKRVLWSGDATGDGRVTYAGAGTDVNAISAAVFTNPLNTSFSPSVPFKGYSRADLNMDGKVIYAGAGTDVNFISAPVFTHPENGGLSATFVVFGQLP